VVMGRCRAKQDMMGDRERRKVVSLLLHGDAAVSGQGVVAECLNMSKLDGYDAGGTVHIVVNNQVGFTTDPRDGRSTEYCTDIGKFVNCAALHVNGDDPAASVLAARLAAEYRHEFRRDIFVDLVCFRRYGHNEQDEPAYTQPALTALVKAHPGTPETFRRALLASGAVSQEQAQAMIDRETTALDAAQALAQKQPVNPVPAPGEGAWKGLDGTYTLESMSTGVDAKTLALVCDAMAQAPAGFNVHPKLKEMMAARGALPHAQKISHADGESLAFGTLLLQGIALRLSGQDARRGTFTHRHAVLRDEKSSEKYTPLNNIRPGQAMLSVWDSPLSEFSVMGFDYGYSRAFPRTLVMWEAQFGDFVNGAQVMIDQYLASSEVKWSRWAGLVLLLPHGYEGQGPEHSSARLERFLQLCADDNMEVVYPSTGAQTFHMLRRQALRNFRKPLIVMTPKKYLRVATSTFEELTKGSFQHLLDDPAFGASAASGASAMTKDVRTVLYCTGKIYHELAARRDELSRKDIAIVRVEQLYPFHTKMARAIDERYPKSAKRVWVQEEPRNQGAFLFVADRFREELGIELGYLGRNASASPATGSEHAHKDQQEDLLTRAVGASLKAGSSNGAHDAPKAGGKIEPKGESPKSSGKR
jgi:2-oxoglutarate dehydrogenase E1 component